MVRLWHRERPVGPVIREAPRAPLSLEASMQMSLRSGGRFRIPNVSLGRDVEPVRPGLPIVHQKFTAIHPSGREVVVTVLKPVALDTPHRVISVSTIGTIRRDGYSIQDERQIQLPLDTRYDFDVRPGSEGYDLILSRSHPRRK